MNEIETANERTYYYVRPAVVAPLLVCGIAITLAIAESMWWLLAIPFAILASICAQPNLNLSDGCLACFSIFIGFGIAFLHWPSGVAIFAGTIVSYFLSAIEKTLTARSQKALELIVEVTRIVQWRLDEMYAAIDTPDSYSALAQVGLKDGEEIVLDYLQNGEEGVAFDHLLYMICEPDIELNVTSYQQLVRIAEMLELNPEVLSEVRHK